jgi:uncharacterized protein YdhG (YjbR/CyaY superfamily)
VSDVDAYLESAPEPHRSTLHALRATLVRLLPQARQEIAYGVAALTLDGNRVAGFGFSPNHCTYFPMSGSITAELAEQLAGYRTAKGSIRFPVDQALPAELVEALVEARLAEIRRLGR